MIRTQYIIGIDEVGRGPIAGPVTLGAVLISIEHSEILKKQFRGVKDSKQLTPEQREQWFAKIRAAALAGHLRYSVTSIQPQVIDKKGLAKVMRLAVKRVLKNLTILPEHALVLLDGSLKAPIEYKNQRTIIKGDEKEPVIALASIVAKVLRDRRLYRLSKKYPQYEFHIHKGYGTRMHYEKIRQFGLCDIHRRSFLRDISLVS